MMLKKLFLVCLVIGCAWSMKTTVFATAPTAPPTYDVTVDLPTSVQAGETVTATVTVHNTSGVTITDVKIAGMLPARTQHVSGGTVDTTIYAGYKYVRFNAPTELTAGQTVQFSHVFTIPADGAELSKYVYEDVFIDGSPVGDNSVYSHFAEIYKTMQIPSTAPPAPAFDPAKLLVVVIAPNPVTGGGNHTIKVEATNLAATATPTFTFSFPIPTGTTYVSGGTLENYQFSGDYPNAPHARFVTGSIAAGASVTFEYIVDIPANPAIGTVYPIPYTVFDFLTNGQPDGRLRDSSASMIVEQSATLVASYSHNGTNWSTPRDGFAFNNYGNSGRNWQNDLSAADIFNIFGPQVCQSGSTAETCKLTAPAEQWRMSQLNGADGGHCEGMAVASIRLFSQLPFNGKTLPADYQSGASTTADLSRNEAVENFAMYYFALQGTDEVYYSYVDNRLAPSAIVNKLITDFNSATPVGYTVGIYKPGYKEGHAIVATGVEKVDDNNYRILVYDNNFPKQRKFIEVNTQTETWRYSTAANPNSDPSAYEGNAQTKTLEIAPISSRDLTAGSYFTCDFCKSSSRDETPPLVVSFDGEGDVLVINDEGQRVGFDFFDTQTHINEIAGVVTRTVKHGLGLDIPPVYEVPFMEGDGLYELYVGAHTITDPTDGSLTIHGPGFVMGFDHIELPADGSTYRFQISPHGELLAIDVDADVVLPAMYIAFEPDSADQPSVIFNIDGLELIADEIAIIELNKTEEWMYFETSDPFENHFDISLTEIYSDGTDATYTTTVTTPPNLDHAYVDFGEWDGEGKVPVVIVTNPTAVDLQSLAVDSSTTIKVISVLVVVLFVTLVIVKQTRQMR